MAVTHNSPRPAPSAATHKSNPVTRPFAPQNSKFPWPPSAADRGWRLIANPRLEFPPTLSKQSPQTFTLPAVAGNREYIALFRFFSAQCHSENRPRPLTRVTPSLPTRNASVPPALLTHGRASRTAGIHAGAFAFSTLSTHRPAVAKLPCGQPLFTSHKSPITSHEFLIYGPAIRNPRNLLKT